MRINCEEALNIVRVIVYIPRVAGDSISTGDFQSIPDETRYTILSDTMLFPRHGNQNRKNFLIKRVNLKGRLTTVDRAGPVSGTVRSNDIRIFILAQNGTTTGSAIYPWYQLKFQNK
jgi:hypothetical protein